MKQTVALLSFLLLYTYIYSQQPGKPAGAPGGKFQMPRIGRLYGKIIETPDKKAVPYASVAIYDLVKDTVVEGVLTQGNGDFNLENLPFGKFKLRIKSIGFKTFEQQVVINQQNIEQDLGNLAVQPDAKDLGTTTITAQKNTLQMGIDRKIFNVDKNIISQGGTAQDVLKNVPSVTLDNDGNVLLRNSATQIYIDGRPTALTANQIPADQIERIEIITNPSAKFDASTSGGILNLVMKRNTKPGYNGVLSAGIGSGYDVKQWGDRYNLMASLNVKQKKINFSISYNQNNTTNPNALGYTLRTDYINSIPFYSDQHSTSKFSNSFKFGRIGMDYYLNNRNTLTANYNLSEGIFNITESQVFNLMDENKNLYQYGDRKNTTYNRFYNHTAQLSWKKTFPKQGKEFSTDLNYIISHSNSLAQYATNNYNGNKSPLLPELQVNTGNNDGRQYTFQMDYVNPITDSIKIEAGVRSYYKYTSSLLSVTNNDSAGEQVYNPYTSSHYALTDMINAAYFNYQQKLKYFGYQAGLRFEQSYFKGDPRNDTQTVFSYNYPSSFDNLWKSLFPSIYLNKKLKHDQEIQLNYSRKINRPNYMQIIPFIMMADKLSYRIGNPRLKPEFINMAEFNYQKNWKKGNLLSSVYYKSIENPLTNYSYRSPDNPSLLATTTVNGKLQTSVGLDNTIKYTFVKRLDLSLNTNIFYTKISSDINNSVFTSQGVNWTGKAIGIYRFPKDITLQLTGNYESPKVIPQGHNRAQYFMDFGLVKEIYKKASINLTVSDVFNTKRMGSFYDTPLYYQELSRRRETRYVKLTFMYRFGKVDASLFKKKTQKPGGQMQGDGMDF